MDSKIFTELSPAKLLLRCAPPAVVTALFGALYSVVDGFFVGKYLGGDALAAVNLIMPVIMIAEAVSSMIAAGASVNMAILLGQGKRKEASEVFSFSLKVILVFSCAAGALGFVFAGPFIAFLAPGANEEAVRYGAEYLKVFSAFAPIIPVYFAADNFLRVCGRQKLCMIINISTQMINVALDIVLIAVLHKGVAAAAAASCISIGAGSVITLLLFTGKKMDVYYTKGRMPVARFMRMLYNGLSDFFSAIAASAMSITVNLFLLRYGGTTAVAAFTVVMYVEEIIGIVSFEISNAMQPAISYCYGAKDKDKMRSLCRLVAVSVMIVSLTVFCIMFFAGDNLVQLFIKQGDTELLDMSKRAVKIMAFSYLFGWVDACFSSMLTAVDLPGRSLVISVFGSLIFPLMFLVVLTSVFELDGVWLMAPAAALASAVMTAIAVKTTIEPFRE